MKRMYRSAIDDYKKFIEDSMKHEQLEEEPYVDRAEDMMINFKSKCQSFLDNNSSKSFNMPFPSNGKVYAIGDIHSDYCTFIICLRLAGVIPFEFTSDSEISQVQWIGGNSIVVQVGDLIGGKCKECNCDMHVSESAESKCISWLKIIKLINTINSIAPYEAGIITLYGNHELRHLIGYNESGQIKQKDLDKHIHKNEFDDATLTEDMDHKRLFEPGGMMAKYLGCASLPILIIGDWIFVHGGVTERFLDHEMFAGLDTPLKKIAFYNMLVKDYTLADSKEDFYFVNPGDKDQYFRDMMMENVSNRIKVISPVWNNKYGAKIKITDEGCNELDSVLERLKIGQLVIGHVPQYDTRDKTYEYRNAIDSPTAINSCTTRMGNTVFRTDINSSFRGCKNKAQIMQISQDGTVKYIANVASNYSDPNKIDRYEYQVNQ